MANRKGVFIGAYVPNELKESLRRRAAGEHRTLSQEITRILTEAIHGRNLPPGSIDRRVPNSPSRRRGADPFPSLSASSSCCSFCFIDGCVRIANSSMNFSGPFAISNRQPRLRSKNPKN